MHFKCRLLQLLAQELVFGLECLDLIEALGLKQLKGIHMLRFFVRQFLLKYIELGLEIVSLLLVLVLASRHSLGSVLQILGLLYQHFDFFFQLFNFVFHFDILRKNI